MNGQFVISLDFEKYWGIFDSIASVRYEENIKNVDIVIEKMLDLSDKYGIKLTFATVGFLFNGNKKELENNIPELTPTYQVQIHNPYSLISQIDDFPSPKNKYFGLNSLLSIKQSGNHEISSHTYSHYYCLENGQTIEQFEADLKMAKKVANDIGIDIKSIVFPRNQVNQEYLKICALHGIVSYRGCENHKIYAPKSKKETKKTSYRVLRILDAYINLTGHHTYNMNTLRNGNIMNIPSSKFLRPYSRKLKLLEPLKVQRVINSMRIAAERKELYHLWFHPHNFGKDLENNFSNLEKIFKAFTIFKSKYGFESTTMGNLGRKSN